MAYNMLDICGCGCHEVLVIKKGVVIPENNTLPLPKVFSANTWPWPAAGSEALIVMIGSRPAPVKTLCAMKFPVYSAATIGW